MLKYSLILLGAYLLYYIGNIVYDLFLKKEKDLQTNATEEFSLGEFAKKSKDEVQKIGIEDVENLNTPKSFSKRELIPTSPGDSDEIQDVEYWRQKFESEENMDDFDNKEESTENAEALLSKNEEKSQNQHHEEPTTSPIQKLNTNKWHQMLNLAETSVQLIANTDGFKTYQSMM